MSHDDRDRDAILARRRAFLTAALATAGLISTSCDDDDTAPRVCLAAPPGHGPAVCLTAEARPRDTAPPEDAGLPEDASAPEDAGDARDAGSPSSTSAKVGDSPQPGPKPPPRPCLKPKPPPTPCLSPPRPKPKPCLTVL